MGTEETQDTKSNKDITTVKVTLSIELHTKLKVKAAQNRTTIQKVLEELISEWVEK